MRIFHGLKSISPSLNGSILTIGNFDGVHRGHRELISQLVKEARERVGPSVVMTFDPHPSKILRPEKPVRRLFDLEDLETEMSKLGVENLIIEPFTKTFAQISAEDFIGQYLWPALRPAEILVGYDFAFGRERGGSYTVLQELAKKYSFGLRRLSPVSINGELISSSRIRRLLEEGLVEKANESLGRPYYLRGVIREGEGRGRKIGFATANLRTEAEVYPAEGVYISEFMAAGRRLPSVTNIGHKPTFHEAYDLSVETHVLNSHENFSGEAASVHFLKRLRPELKFASADDLVQQIRQDVAAAKNYFNLKSGLDV